MPTLHDIQSSPFSPDQLFDLVADIEKYPEFLPWCRAARILKREENVVHAELVICFKSFCESYTSRVVMHRPTGVASEGKIEVEMVQGPFDFLMNHWKFIPDKSGTKIDFFIDFRFRSKILEKLVGSLFAKANSKMVEAFRTRAESIYSKNKG
jgi:coenzyme Q-binding protein COQ10